MGFRVNSNELLYYSSNEVNLFKEYVIHSVYAFKSYLVLFFNKSWNLIHFFNAFLVLYIDFCFIDLNFKARNAENGKKAVAELEKEGLSPKFYQLDILDTNQINEFVTFLKKTYGGVDILVNNAAILYVRVLSF